MNKEFRAPNCFRFVDYINICSIRVLDDVVCLYGVYHDPVRGKVIPSYFETDFNFFYSLLNDADCINNADKGIEAMIESLGRSGDDSTIELEMRSIVELHSMVIRLSLLVEEAADGTVEPSGFFIEDAYPMQKGLISFDRYLRPPEIQDEDREIRVAIARSFRSMSGYLVVLALRYEYYLQSTKEGKCETEALFHASLEDQGVFEMARGAFQLIDGVREAQLI